MVWNNLSFTNEDMGECKIIEIKNSKDEKWNAVDRSINYHTFVQFMIDEYNLGQDISPRIDRLQYYIKKVDMPQILHRKCVEFYDAYKNGDRISCYIDVFQSLLKIEGEINLFKFDILNGKYNEDLKTNRFLFVDRKLQELAIKCDTDITTFCEMMIFTKKDSWNLLGDN